MTRRTVHFVYVPGEGIRQPYSITNEVAARLCEHYDVVIHDWEGASTIVPQPGDILLGHPHYKPGRTFTNSFWQDGWSKRLPLIPFSFGMKRFLAAFDEFLDPLVEKADCLLAICGTYWSDHLKDSMFSHWQSKFVQVDLAVRQDQFPLVKERFSSPGDRRFVYIGSAADYKATDFLVALTEQNRNLKFGWIGTAPGQYANIHLHGNLDFASSQAVDIVRQYDYLLTCGRSDANPTTILEAAAWGLVPVCTPQSGYVNQPWIFNIPLDNEPAASQILQALNNTPEADLLQMQKIGVEQIQKHYNWDRFAKQIFTAIESPPMPTISPAQWEFHRRQNKNALRRFRMKETLDTRINLVVNKTKRLLRGKES